MAAIRNLHTAQHTWFDTCWSLKWIWQFKGSLFVLGPSWVLWSFLIWLYMATVWFCLLYEIQWYRFQIALNTTHVFFIMHWLGCVLMLKRGTSIHFYKWFHLLHHHFFGVEDKSSWTVWRVLWMCLLYNCSAGGLLSSNCSCWVYFMHKHWPLILFWTQIKNMVLCGISSSYGECLLCFSSFKRMDLDTFTTFLPW